MEGNLYPKVMDIRWRWDGDNNDYITYLNPKNNSVNILNPVAARIFSLCNSTNTVDGIVETLYGEYDVPSKDIIRRDVEEFINFMSKDSMMKLLSDSEFYR